MGATKLTILAILLAAPAFQEGGNAEASADDAMDLSILPQGCRDAIQPSAMDRMMQGMNMSGMMQDMNETQQAYTNAMMRMNGPMMATHAIEDADLAFNCGMIAHHAGAIAMAEIELEHGDDEASRQLAREIIDAQRQEIEEMTAWVEEHTAR